jgi:hypothetical protein
MGCPWLGLLPSFLLLSHHTTYPILAASDAARPSFGYALAEGILVSPLLQQISTMDEHQRWLVTVHSPRQEAANPSHKTLPIHTHPTKRTAPHPCPSFPSGGRAGDARRAKKSTLISKKSTSPSMVPCEDQGFSVLAPSTFWLFSLACRPRLACPARPFRIHSRNSWIERLKVVHGFCWLEVL